MEAKVRFMGFVEEVAGATVGVVLEEEGGEFVGVLWAKLADVEEADVSLEKDDIWGIWGVEQLGEVASGVLFGVGEEDLAETVLDSGLEDTAGVKGFDPFEGGGESTGLEVVCSDGWEE